MTVSELSKDQILQLKQDYLIAYYEEVGEEDGPSAEELENADSIVSDAIIFEAYSATIFSPEEFF